MLPLLVCGQEGPGSRPDVDDVLGLDVLAFSWHDALFTALLIVCVPMLIARLFRRATRAITSSSGTSVHGRAPKAALAPPAPATTNSCPSAGTSPSPTALPPSPSSSPPTDRTYTPVEGDLLFDCTDAVRELREVLAAVGADGPSDGTVAAALVLVRHMRVVLATACNPVNRKKNKQALVCNSLLACDGLQALQVRRNCCVLVWLRESSSASTAVCSPDVGVASRRFVGAGRPNPAE